jgi:hypothetical protein
MGIGGTTGSNYFFIRDRKTGGDVRLIINDSGNVGIGTNTVNNIFQVGDGGKLRISNGINDYSLIGTKDTDENTINTKIMINGNTCSIANAPGSIQHFATGTGGHIFYNNGEKVRFDNNGNVTCSGNLGVGSAAATNGINLAIENI